MKRQNASEANPLELLPRGHWGASSFVIPTLQAVNLILIPLAQINTYTAYLNHPPDLHYTPKSSTMSPFQPLTGTRLQDEQAFAKRYLDQISGHDVNYDDDLVTPPEKRPRKMPALSVCQTLYIEDYRQQEMSGRG